METSQLGTTSHSEASSTAPKQDDNLDKSSKPESFTRPSIWGRTLEGIRSSFRQTKKGIDDANPEVTSTSIIARKRKQTVLTAALSPEISIALDHGVIIKDKIKELASGKVTVGDFMKWYEPEQNRIVSQVSLYNHFENIKSRLNKMINLSEKLCFLIEKLTTLKENLNTREIMKVEKERGKTEKNRHLIINDIIHSFEQIAVIYQSLPRESAKAKEVDSSSQLNLGLSLSEQAEEGKLSTENNTNPAEPCSYQQLMNNPEMALHLHNEPDTYNAIMAKLTHFMQQSEAKVIAEGRKLPRGLAREQCRSFFFSCCSWELDDINLINQLETIHPKRQAITQLAVLICDHFMEESLKKDTQHAWLTKRENKYREEAKLARGRCVLEEKRTDTVPLVNIIGRPAGLRQDVEQLIKKLPELMVSPSSKDRKKLEKLGAKAKQFLKDQNRNKNLLKTNCFVLDCYYHLRNVLNDIPGPHWWFLNWPSTYADYTQAIEKKRLVPRSISEAEDSPTLQRMTSLLALSNSEVHVIEP